MSGSPGAASSPKEDSQVNAARAERWNQPPHAVSAGTAKKMDSGNRVSQRRSYLNTARKKPVASRIGTVNVPLFEV